ncbi:gliding motility-associated lipoprotein GldH [Nitritalea halalkaliphila LW7]|uniref:Gliding motility-associated lipoprotein GldH n=1 Tax=Nitritalea halalkaliphila LW7 TaxID=1189621 RepID=I5C502_9BACT|nr:gliding motility-associated lipoprotein GldH [Nitritalea halalkaliphila]EIM76904.1 gliding motility-associated lipoprotein GldH [Nitritalea halalkaliphila LW7]
MIKKGLLAFGVGLLCLACNQNRHFEIHQGLPAGRWLAGDTLRYSPGVDILPGTLWLSPRYTSEYPYRNLYVRYLLLDSAGQVIEENLHNLALFHPQTGEPLGTGFGKSFSLSDSVQINSEGGKELLLLQYMRREDLSGVEGFGIRQNKKN